MDKLHRVLQKGQTICLSMSLSVMVASLMNMCTWKCSYLQLTKRHQRQSFVALFLLWTKHIKVPQAWCAESPLVNYWLYQVCVSLVNTILKATEIISSVNHSNSIQISKLCSLAQCTWHTYRDSYRECYYNNIGGYKCIIYTSAYVRAMHEPHMKVQIELRGDCGCKHDTLIYGCLQYFWI